MSTTKSAPARERELDDSQDGRSPKRTKLDESLSDPKASGVILLKETHTDLESENLLPPSHVLLGTSEPTFTPDATMYRILEADVGISEYISRDVPKISGNIKQRYGSFFD